MRASEQARALAVADESTTRAASRLAKMRKGRRYTAVGKFPDDSETFAWRLLSGVETDEAVAAAVSRLHDLNLPVELRAYSDLEGQLAWEILARAMRDDQVPGTEANPYPTAFCKSSLEMRSVLTEDERDTLYADYMDFCESVDPDPVELPDELYRAIESAIKKKERGNLISFGSRMLATYLLTTDSRPSS